MRSAIDFFRSNPRLIRRMLQLDSVVTALAALPMIVVPEPLIRLLDLGAVAPWVVRLTGVVWLSYALWLAWIQHRPLGRPAAAFALFMMVGTALEALLGPVLFETGTGWLGWSALLAVVLMTDGMTLVWLAVWRETDEGGRLMLPTGARI